MELLRVSFSMVHRVMENAVGRGLNRREQVDYEHLSLDEKSMRKGHTYISVLLDQQSKTVIDVVEGRTQEATEKLLSDNIKPEKREKVKTVSMDFWKAYQNAVEVLLPNAAKCHDKFHLVKHLNEAVDDVRRKEVQHQSELKKSRYLWLKDINNFTESQQKKFDSIKEITCKTAEAWQIKENFRAIEFKEQDLYSAFSIFNQWYIDAKKSSLNAVQKVADMFARNATGIINAIKNGKSNASAERMNGNIQLLKANARGYSCFENFRTAILFYHGNLDLYP